MLNVNDTHGDFLLISLMFHANAGTTGLPMLTL